MLLRKLFAAGDYSQTQDVWQVNRIQLLPIVRQAQTPVLVAGSSGFVVNIINIKIVCEENLNILRAGGE